MLQNMTFHFLQLSVAAERIVEASRTRISTTIDEFRFESKYLGRDSS